MPPQSEFHITCHPCFDLLEEELETAFPMSITGASHMTRWWIIINQSTNQSSFHPQYSTPEFTVWTPLLWSSNWIHQHWHPQFMLCTKCYIMLQISMPHIQSHHSCYYWHTQAPHLAQNTLWCHCSNVENCQGGIPSLICFFSYLMNMFIKKAK